MNTRQLVRLLLLASGLCGCAGNPTPETQPPQTSRAEKIVRMDGSSTVAPVSELAAAEFHKANPHVRVPISTSGTGGGFRKFVKGEIDISNASRPILRAEIDQAKKHGISFVELPICFDALTVVVNKANDWATDITVAELRTMWSPQAQGKITRWNQVRPTWPDEPLELYGPGRDSGTFDYFTEAINGKAGECRADFLANEDDNWLVRGVVENKYALGYFGYAYFAAYRDKLTALKIKAAPDREAVEPGTEGIRNGSYAPLSRPLFIYVNRAAAERSEVAEFVTFFLSNASSLAARKKYVPLTPAAYGLVLKRFQERKTGTAFGGAPTVGLSLDDLLQRELRVED